MPYPFALDVFADLSGFVRDTLWVVAAIIGATAIMVYLLALLSRYFIYLKAQDSRYFDASTLDIAHRVIEVLAIAIWVLVVLLIAGQAWPDVLGFLAEIVHRVPAAFFVIVTFLVAGILVRALRRFGAYLRGELPVKPRRLAQPRLWGVTELLLKYLIIAVALLVAFVGAVGLLPAEVPEKGFLDAVSRDLTTPSSTLLTAIAIAVVGVSAAFGLTRLADSVFDDMKQRSRRHGPKVLDQFKGVTRLAIYLLTATAVLFLEFGLFLSAEQLIVVAVIFATLVVVALVASLDAVRDAFAGLALMQADPFAVGDRVKIGDDLVGDVTAISLTMTSVRTGRGETVALPNRQVLSAPVLNFTRSEHHPIFVEVAVPWDVPHRTVEALLLDAAKRTPGVLDVPPPQVFGKDVAGNAIVHQLLAYTNDPEQMKQVKSVLLYTIQDLFHEKKLKALSTA